MSTCLVGLRLTAGFLPYHGPLGVIHLAAIADGGNGTAAIRGIALTLGKANVTLAVRFRNACAPST